MIGRVGRGSDFHGLAKYLLGNRSRVAFAWTRNLPHLDAESIARKMSATAARSRRCRKPVYHLIVSWDPADEPSQDQIFRAAELHLTRLGLEDHQALIVAHNDRDHVHVMVNRVHPQTGRAWGGSLDFRRIERTNRDLEARWGLRPPAPGKGTVLAVKRGAESL